MNLSAQKVEWFSSGLGDESAVFNGASETGWDVLKTSDGIYVSGVVIGEIAILGDSTYAINNINNDYTFLAKYDDSGHPLWFKNFEGYRDSHLAAFSDGSVALSVKRNFNSIVYKFNAQGDSLWSKELMLTDGLGTFDSNRKGFFRVNDLAVNSTDEVVLTGYVVGPPTNEGVIVFENDTIPHFLGRQYAGYVAKFSDSGVYQWIKVSTGSERFEFRDIAIKPNDDIVAVGDYEHDPAFPLFVNGADTLSGVITPSGNKSNFVLAEYSSTGNLNWVNTEGGGDEDFGNGVVANALGEIFTVGSFFSETTFGDTSFSSQNIVSYDGLLAKFDEDGTFEWSRRFDGNGHAAARTIALDSAENIIVGGEYGNGLIFNDGVVIDSLATSVTFSGFVAYLVQYDNAGNFLKSSTFDEAGSFIKKIFIKDSFVFITGGTSGATQYLGEEIPVAIPNRFHFFVGKIDLQGTATNDGTTAIFKLEESDLVEVYPNPTADVLTIKIPDASGQILVEIYNSLGQKVLSQKQAGDATLDLSSWPAGIYRVVAFKDNLIDIHSVVKQ